MSKLATLLTAYKDDYELYAKSVLKIRTKAGQIVPFEFNRAQKRVWRAIKEARDAGKPVRLYLLKARQLGMSTFAEGLGYWFLTLNSHRDGLIVSHEVDSAAYVFGIMQRFWTFSPEEFRPMRKISNRREMVFANPDKFKSVTNPGLQSQVVIATADNPNMGIGRTVQFVHLSELARYETVNPNIRESMSAMKQAVPEIPDTYIIVETTAQGFGYAKDFWDSKNSYQKIFISWIADEEYTAEESLEEIELSHHPESEWGDEGEALKHVLKELEYWYPELDETERKKEAMHRLAWRRKKISDDFEHNVQLFQQEYPLTPEEAFLSTGSGIFDALKLRDMKMILKESGIIPTRFRFIKSEDDFVEAPYGEVRIYEQPLQGAKYVIGADPSEGVSHGDNSAAQVLKMPEAVQVATVQQVMSPDDFADLLNRLGRIYNNAFIAIEINGPGLSTQLRLHKVLRYPRMYRREVLDHISRKHQKKFGWHSNKATKPLAINDLRAALAEDLLQINDLPTVDELAYFTQHGEGKYAAEGSKSDDLVISLALAWQMALQAARYFNVENQNERSAYAPPGSFNYYDNLLRQQEAYGDFDYAPELSIDVEGFN